MTIITALSDLFASFDAENFDVILELTVDSRAIATIRHRPTQVKWFYSLFHRQFLLQHRLSVRSHCLLFWQINTKIKHCRKWNINIATQIAVATRSSLNVNHVTECHVNSDIGSGFDATFRQRVVPKVVGRKVHHQQAAGFELQLDRRRRRGRGFLIN